MSEKIVYPGHGHGLDADLVDGMHSEDILRKARMYSGGGPEAGLPCSYLVSKEGIYYKAIDGKTGKIAFSGTDAYTVLELVKTALLAAGGGIIFAKAVDYNMTNTFPSTDVSASITLRGEGLKTRFLATGINAINVDKIKIIDLQWQDSSGVWHDVTFDPNTFSDALRTEIFKPVDIVTVPAGSHVASGTVSIWSKTYENLPQGIRMLVYCPNWGTKSSATASRVHAYLYTMDGAANNLLAGQDNCGGYGNGNHMFFNLDLHCPTSGKFKLELQMQNVTGTDAWWDDIKVVLYIPQDPRVYRAYFRYFSYAGGGAALGSTSMNFLAIYNANTRCMLRTYGFGYSQNTGGVESQITLSFWGQRRKVWTTSNGNVILECSVGIFVKRDEVVSLGVANQGAYYNAGTFECGVINVDGPILDKVEVVAGNITTSGNTISSAVEECGLADKVLCLIEVAGVTGTTPTLDVLVKTKNIHTGSDNWFTIYTFPQITATGFYKKVLSIDDGLLHDLAFFYTVGGSNPMFTVKIAAYPKG